ncbi:mpv17-like protein 2 [Teleopsis dalmanni]|uniref:mpv17-like protein 2 n=1 Tax=Teleopsis dalmanni TaxID=139649 RepID=UPI0018CE7265|nr:mpv17-like protein 2 [Teleopsis dalmanni]
MFARHACRIVLSNTNVLHGSKNILNVHGNGAQILKNGIRKIEKTAGAEHSIAKKAWNKIFGKFLLATNIIGSGALMVVGDVAAQQIEFKRSGRAVHSSFGYEHFDFERMGRMFVVGALMGPLHHYVYNWMDRVMPIANFRNTIQKILIDQLFMSPACILIFFYGACFLENKTLKETNDELVEKFPIVYLMDWMLWPGVQYINFRYLDTKYRVTFVNVCTALYNIFMSYIKHDFHHLQ